MVVGTAAQKAAVGVGLIKVEAVEGVAVVPTPRRAAVLVVSSEPEDVATAVEKACSLAGPVEATDGEAA